MNASDARMAMAESKGYISNEIERIFTSSAENIKMRAHMGVSHMYIDVPQDLSSTVTQGNDEACHRLARRFYKAGYKVSYNKTGTRIRIDW
jgi:hypothetical protein